MEVTPYFQTCYGDEGNEGVDAELLGPKHYAFHFARATVQRVCSKYISEAELNSALNRWLPRPDDPLAHKRVLQDAVFLQIREKLEMFGKGEWSLRPRTFAVLRMLGCPEALDDFVAQRRTDSFLPYTEGNLPDAIKGHEKRRAFFRFQQLVLCNQKDISELEKGGGKHLQLSNLGDTYFESQKMLGRGHFGIVQQVYSRQTLLQYARKLIHRGASALKDGRLCQQFETEIQALKKLSHGHIVKLVGSYTDEHHLGILMTPIADRNLEEYLRSTQIDVDERKRTLRSFFGCLGTALAYLHSRNVRHNDIKSRNVLVKDSSVYLTDFGTSRSWETEEASTTLAEQEGFTMRYCAPEMHDTKAARNRASDIWSLGCVFLEISTVLLGKSLEDLDTFLQENGSLRHDAFWANQEGIRQWISKLRQEAPKNSDLKTLDWTASMLQYDSQLRPTAHQLRGAIIDFVAPDPYICHICASPSGLAPSSKSKSSLLMDDTRKDAEGLSESKPTIPITASELGISERPTEFETPLVGRTSITGTPMRGTYPSRTPRPQALPAPEAGQQAAVKTIEGPRRSKAQERYTPSSLTHDADEGPAGPRKLPEDHQLGNLRINDGAKSDISKPPQGQVAQREARFGALPEDRRPDHTQLDAVSFEEDTLVRAEPMHSPAAEFREHIEQEETRFGALPEHRRPERTQIDVADGDAGDVENQQFVCPEPIRPPPFERAVPLPKASLAPSYVLAGTNHFSRTELNAQQRSALHKNLFVYGRFMFPSVLFSTASQSTKGVYSNIYKRRIRPMSEDWVKADYSIRRASETMTPARLEGYDRWRPDGLNCPVIQSSKMTPKILREWAEEGLEGPPSPPPGHVDGFLIPGLGPEAIRYCDLVFSSTTKNLRSLRPRDEVEEKDDNGSDSGCDVAFRGESRLEREAVEVQVRTNDGELVSVIAETYVWPFGIEDLNDIWEEERFLRSSPMQKILADQPSWKEEEQTLANIMKISFTQVGDYLANAILADDYDELDRLLQDRFDPNAPCRVYGNALQTAVVKGDEDMVRLLIKHNADVNARGGQYGTPLIAAAYSSRKAITKCLLHYGAEVFANDDEHVNPLYQAVAHSDYTVTEMLLEHGAWVSESWAEILDLAAELGDKEIRSLLARYDVRQIHRRHMKKLEQNHRQLEPRSQRLQRLRETSEEAGEGSWDLDAGGYSSILGAVVSKCAAVRSISGNWKGRRGVMVTVAALDAGAPLKLIDLLRRAAAPVRAILEILRQKNREQEEGRSGEDEEEDEEDEATVQTETVRTDYTPRKRNPKRGKPRAGGVVDLADVVYGVEALEIGSGGHEVEGSRSRGSRKQGRVIDVSDENAQGARRVRFTDGV